MAKSKKKKGIDSKTLALAKKYTKDTVKGMGAIKGDRGEKGEKGNTRIKGR